MAGVVIRAASFDITATTSIDLNLPGGAHGATAYLLDVTGITGTWDVAVSWFGSSSNSINVVNTTGMTTTGMRRLALTSDFSATRQAAPAGKRVTLTLAVGPGSISGVLYAAYGD